MKSMLNRISAAAVRLHRCNRGAEGLEKILIVGAIVLPLLGALIFFREALVNWLSSLWGDVQSDNQDYQQGGDVF